VWTDTNTNNEVDAGERSDITEYTWDVENRLTNVTFRDSNGDVTKAVDQIYDMHGFWIGREVDTDGARCRWVDIEAEENRGGRDCVSFTINCSATYGPSQPQNRYTLGPKWPFATP